MSLPQVCKPAYKAATDYDRAHKAIDAEAVIVDQYMQKGAVALARAMRHVELREPCASSHGLQAWNCDDEPLAIPGLLMERMVGAGAFATVYKGRWNNTDVAVKVGQHACWLPNQM